MSLGVGHTVGARYELLEELGRGAHGAVYKAKDHHVGEVIALKVLLGVGDHDLALLRRELSAARRITHRGVVRMYDLVEVDGGFALSMELVEGESLARLLEAGPLPPPRVTVLAMKLAEALAAAHEAGITHRDLKPANILVRSDGSPVITDFGISRLPDAGVEERRGDAEHVSFTAQGAIIGTPLYMAPEQLRGEAQIDQSVDVYAWGLVVHEMLTGQVPHQASTVVELLARREHEAPPPLESAGLSTRLVETVARCLARDPLQRPRTGQALLDQLVPPAEPVPSVVRPRPRRHWLGLVVLGLVTVLAAAVLWIRRPLEPPAPTTDTAPAASADLFRVVNARRVTFDPGCEEFGNLLSDEETLLFDKSVGEKSHLFTKNLRTGEERQLTTSPKWDFAATASPDGEIVAFLRLDEQVTAQLLTLSTGVVEPLGRSDARPTFDRDGRSVWIGRQGEVTRVDLVTREVLETLHTPEGTTALRVVSLADGRRAALLRASDRFASQLALFDGAWRILRVGVFRDILFTSRDGLGIIAVSDQSSLDRLLVAWRDGAEATLPTLLASNGALSVSGAHAVWTDCDGRRELLPLAQATTDLGVRGLDGRSAAGLSDGRVMLVSPRDGTRNKLWIADAERRSLREVQGPFGVPEEVVARADEVVVATSTGIWRTDLARGAGWVAWTNNPTDAQPSIASDGALVFVRGAAGRFEVMRQPDVDGPPQVLTTGTVAVAHPLEAKVFFSDGTDLHVLEGDVTRVLNREPLGGEVGPLSISPDGARVATVVARTDAVVVDTSTGRVLERVSSKTGSLRRLTFAATGRIEAIREVWDGDLWVGDVVRD